MSDKPVLLDEWISRHFDEDLDPAARENLAEALQSDPSARRAFAATARLHYSLEAMAAPTLKPSRKPKWVRRLACGSAAAVAAAGVFAGSWYFLNAGKFSAARVTVWDPVVPSKDPVNLPGPRLIPKRVVKATAAPGIAASGEEEVMNLLSRYYVNVSPQGLTVPQALRQLEEAIQFENILKRPELDQLAFRAGKSWDPESADPRVFTPEQPPMTVSNYLEICRLYREVLSSGGPIPGSPNVPLVDEGTDADGAALVPEVREYRVTKDFIDVNALPLPRPEGNAAAARLARSFGIQLNQNESATFSSNPSTLTVYASRRKLDQLRIRMAQSLSGRASNVFLVCQYRKLSRASLPPGFDESSGMILTDQDWQNFQESSARNPANAVVAMPSMIVRAGQKGRLDMLKEIGIKDKPSEQIGASQSMVASLCGELVRVEGSLDLGVMEGLGMPGALPDLGLVSGGHTTPTTFKTEYELWLPDKSTGLFIAESPQAEGFVTLICITSTLIDQSGQARSGEVGGAGQGK